MNPIPGRASLFILNHARSNHHFQEGRHVIEPNDTSSQVGELSTPDSIIVDSNRGSITADSNRDSITADSNRDSNRDSITADSNRDSNRDSVTCRRVFSYSKDGLFDLTWSENDPSILWAGSGDGSIQIYSLKQGSNEALSVVKGHEKEISCIEWSNNRQNGPLVLTSSWDGSVKVWDGMKGCEISHFSSPVNIIYSVSWSPLIPRTFCSSLSDGSLCVYDLNQNSGFSSIHSSSRYDINNQSSTCAIKIPVSKSELLSCDWNKYNQNIIIASAVDGLISGIDIRSPSTPLLLLPGHSRAIKKVKFSPFKESILASVSYDFTTRIWDLNHFHSRNNSTVNPGINPTINSSPLILTMQNHTEFVYGLDWNLHHPDVLVDCSWDQSLVISSPFDASLSSDGSIHSFQ